ADSFFGPSMVLRVETIATPAGLLPDVGPMEAREPIGGMSSVRWLAELCGLPRADVFPSLASALLDSAAPQSPTTAYVDWWIRHPDPGSRFEWAMRPLRKVPEAAVVPTLRDKGYDGLLYQRQGEILGHVF